MKKLLLLLPLFALLWSCNGGAGSASSDSAELKTLVDSFSYAQGMMMAKQMKELQDAGMNPIVNTAALKAGLDEGMKGGEGIIPEAEMQGVMMRFQTELQSVQQKMQVEEQMKAAAAGAENKVKSDAFLAENANKEGVVTTASGLQYKITKKGSGASPTKADKVEVDYEGRLIDGTVFDSSYKSGKHATFGVTQVIPGWTEGLQLMKEGAEYQFYIPAELAYGNNAPPSIGPGQALVFDVILHKVNP